MFKKLIIKITSIIVLFSLILFVFLLLNNLNNQKKVVIPLFIERAKATAYSMEAGIRDEQELKDQERLLTIIQKNMWLDPDITNVSINTLKDGRLASYASNEWSQVNQASDQDNLDVIHRDAFAGLIKQTDNSEILTAITPIHVSGKIVGTIQIDFDLSNINNQIKDTADKDTIYYLVIFLFSIIILIIIFELAIVRPILQIDKGVKAITNLDFDYKIKIGSRDEIGNLANAFNRMGDELKESKIKLNQYNQALEKQVAEKTDELKNVNFDLEKKVKERTATLEELKVNQEKTIAERTAELSRKLAELEKMNSVMVDREIKMIELKEEIKKLKEGKG